MRYQYPNKIDWHDYDDGVSYCYKRGIIYGAVGLVSWGSLLKIQQRGAKSKAPSNLFIFQKWKTFEILVDTYLV